MAVAETNQSSNSERIISGFANSTKTILVNIRQHEDLLQSVHTRDILNIIQI